MKLSKNVNNKKCVPEMILFNEYFFGNIQMIIKMNLYSFLDSKSFRTLWKVHAKLLCRLAFLRPKMTSGLLSALDG